jgi:Raf kinase inhibitor-like YbhB/YbcL family protein
LNDRFVLLSLIFYSLAITWILEYILVQRKMITISKCMGWVVSLGILLLLAGCQGESTPAALGGNEMTISITSTAFKEGDKIPPLYTCDDQNVSPALAWTGVPDNTASLALIMDDPDAPAGTWVHWVLFNLPASLTGLAQGKDGGGTLGKNDFNKLGYGGPCPPRGSTHRYYIKVYALDQTLDLKSGATKAEVEKAVQGHILAQGQLMGRYGR